MEFPRDPCVSIHGTRLEDAYCHDISLSGERMTDVGAPISFDADRVLRWYAGRARERVMELLPRIAESIAQGQWQPGLSRSARAALRRQVTCSGSRRIALWWEVHAPLAYRHDGKVNPVKLDKLLYWGSESNRLYRAMTQGSFSSAPDLIESARRIARSVLERRPALTVGEECAAIMTLAWVEDFTPLARAFQSLDETRPKPIYAFREISRVVFDNIGQKMELAFESVRMPEIRWSEQDRVVGKAGEIAKVWIAEIRWPEGTRHGVSRFASGSQCEACGHGIRSGRWIPLVLDGPGGPASLWVGRDCARHLFGCRASNSTRSVLFGGPSGPEEVAP